MKTVPPAKALPRTPFNDRASEASLRRVVRQFVNGLYPGTPFVERRRESRYPYPHLISLQPAAADGQPLPNCDPIVVVGRHITEKSLAFFHQQPLPYRRVIATLEAREGRELRFLLDLNWCRFTRHGWYEGGGRLMRLLEATGE